MAGGGVGGGVGAGVPSVRILGLKNVDIINGAACRGVEMDAFMAGVRSNLLASPE